MESGLTSSSEPLEPDRVWTREEWLAERRWQKHLIFLSIYSGGPKKLGEFLDVKA